MRTTRLSPCRAGSSPCHARPARWRLAGERSAQDFPADRWSRPSRSSSWRCPRPLPPTPESNYRRRPERLWCRSRPGAAMRRPTGNFLVRLAEPDEFRFQFASEARALQTLLVEIRLQVRALHVSCGVLIAFLSVFAGFDKIFQHADSVIFIHNSLRSLDAASRPRFGRIRRARGELGRNVIVL